jgi:hypothetical protein
LSKLSTSLLEVALSSEDVLVNSKVWNEVILIVLVHISLEFLVSSGLSLASTVTIASWSRSHLHKLSTGLLEVVLGGNNVMINTKVWDEVVFVMLVHISLELLVGSSLSLQTSWEVSRVASWD